MNIDLFTLVAQIVNFLILLVALKLLLYGRIVRVMDEREERIAARLNEAEQREQQAEGEKASYQEKRREVEQEREAILAEARDEADENRRAFMDQAREETEKAKARWQESIREERKEFLRELRRRAGERIVGVSRRVLADLADEDLERQVAATFIERLRRLGEDESAAMAESAREAGGRIAIRSAFELPEEMREKLRGAIQDVVTEDGHVAFRTDTELLCGIDLRAGGRKLSWSFDSYLDALEDSVADLIEQQAGREDEAHGEG